MDNDNQSRTKTTLNPSGVTAPSQTKEQKSPAISSRAEATENPKGQPARRKLVDRRDGDNQLKESEADRRSEQERRGSGSAKGAANDRELSRHELKIQQHRKKKLLAGCEPVMGLNYDTLAMDDYPSNQAVALAKKDRDYWIVICSIFTSVFLFGFIGLVPPIASGVACGTAALSFALAFSPLRKRFFDSPSLRELMHERKKIEFRALNHIQFLEAPDGLAWRCEKMHKYNSNLDRKLFKGLVYFSRKQSLLNIIRSRKQIRLYLLFMIESQKAYKRLQKDYLENHFKHVDQGWDDSLSDAESKNLSDQIDGEPPVPTGRQRS